MASTLWKSLVSMFGRTHSNEWNRDMLIWAKTEYGKDWEFAYHFMKNNNGKAPHVGVTL